LDQRRLKKTLHKQTDRHYENNDHLAVNQLLKLHNMLQHLWFRRLEGRTDF